MVCLRIIMVRFMVREHERMYICGGLQELSQMGLICEKRGRAEL